VSDERALDDLAERHPLARQAQIGVGPHGDRRLEHRGWPSLTSAPERDRRREGDERDAVAASH